MEIGERRSRARSGRGLGRRRRRRSEEVEDIGAEEEERQRHQHQLQPIHRRRCSGSWDEFSRRRCYFCEYYYMGRIGTVEYIYIYIWSFELKGIINEWKLFTIIMIVILIWSLCYGWFSFCWLCFNLYLFYHVLISFQHAVGYLWNSEQFYLTWQLKMQRHIILKIIPS